MDLLLNDVRHSLRALVRSPGFTLAAIAALALGIGANTAIFSVINTVLLKPLAYPDPERIVQFMNLGPNGPFPSASVTKFNVWRTQTSVIQDAAAYSNGGAGMNLTGVAHPEQIQVSRVSANFFRLFGARTIIGRTFTPEEDRPNGGRNVVLSSGLWQRRFGSDAGVAGKTVDISGEPYTIIGVIGPEFPSDTPVDAWTAFQFDPNSIDQSHYFRAAARLRPGVTLAQANAQLALAADEFRRRYPTFGNSKFSFGVKPLQDQVVGDARTSLLVLAGANWLSFRFQGEDSRVFGQNTQPAPASQKDAMDLRIGYVQVGGESGPVSLTAGRQVLDFGDARLVGDPGWSNVGRTFDAARLTLRHRQLKVDVFSGTSVKVSPLDFDQPAPGEHFDGIYGSLGGLIPNAKLEPYVLWRMEHNYKAETGRAGNLDEKTSGLRWVGKLPLGFDYTSEFASQFGSWAGDGIVSWMGHWVLGNTLADTIHRPRVYAEYNRASGNADAHDGRHSTFDPLFPSPHDKYGLVDLFSSSNIVHFRSGFEYRFRRSLGVSVAYNDFRLENPHDGLYSGGKVVASNGNGGTATHIGQEPDVQAQWAMSRSTNVIAGYGRLFSGEFLQRSNPGVSYNIFSLSVAQRF